MPKRARTEEGQTKKSKVAPFSQFESRLQNLNNKDCVEIIGKLYKLFNKKGRAQQAEELLEEYTKRDNHFEGSWDVKDISHPDFAEFGGEGTLFIKKVSRSGKNNYRGKMTFEADRMSPTYKLKGDVNADGVLMTNEYDPEYTEHAFDFEVDPNDPNILNGSTDDFSESTTFKCIRVEDDKYEEESEEESDEESD
ncbi:linear gramicidin synthase subunit C [Acrasis kona]|uniref:Linear gramicidin synthase subunit C n=1 Tax=Acrasis kona TaxID=1008807 RepID=A0AAW2YMX3_9EUKA